MQALKVKEITSDNLDALSILYYHTKHPRIRTRAQMILLAVEQQMTAPQIAKIVRCNAETVRRWIKRYNVEGLNGLFDAPRPGQPTKVTAVYKEKLLTIVRQKPRALDLPFSVWTLARLVDYLAEETGIRVSTETVRLYLKENDIVFSRPQHHVSSPDPEYKVKKRRLKTKETI